MLAIKWRLDSCLWPCIPVDIPPLVYALIISIFWQYFKELNVAFWFWKNPVLFLRRRRNNEDDKPQMAFNSCSVASKILPFNNKWDLLHWYTQGGTDVVDVLFKYSTVTFLMCVFLADPNRSCFRGKKMWNEFG